MSERLYQPMGAGAACVPETLAKVASHNFDLLRAAEQPCADQEHGTMGCAARSTAEIATHGRVSSRACVQRLYMKHECMISARGAGMCSALCQPVRAASAVHLAASNGWEGGAWTPL